MRPSWDDFFFGLAFDYSRRSRDARTKHGCILVDPRNNHIIGTGYNSFLAGLPDSELPSEGEAKYAHMDHSEVNAVDSMTRDAWGIPGGAIAYISGTPCYQCARALVRHNVLHWKVALRAGYSEPPPDQEKNLERLIAAKNVRVEVVRPNLDWKFDRHYVAELRRLGFLSEE